MSRAFQTENKKYKGTECAVSLLLLSMRKQAGMSSICMIIWYKKEVIFLCVQQVFTRIIKEEEKHSNNLGFMFDDTIMRKGFYYYYRYYFQVNIINIFIGSLTVLLGKEKFQTLVTEINNHILFYFLPFLTYYWSSISKSFVWTAYFLEQFILKTTSWTKQEFGAQNQLTGGKYLLINPLRNYHTS